MRRRPLVVLAVVVATLLAACGGGLSTKSPIQPGLEVGSVQENEIRVEASPIRAGASPQEVVEGFIRAAAASDDQYLVARSYLTPDAAASWRPDTSVVVFGNESVLDTRQSGPGEVTARATATAKVDGTGRYTELPADSTVQVGFRVAQRAGEWRITTLPANFGIWLSNSDFLRLYDPFRIYFISTTQRRLVPDVRWLSLGTGLATRLARSLLSGAPDYLKGAVRSDVPQGTRLAVDAVTIDSGTATVDLTATRLATDPGQRQNLGAQFLATVSQAPGVDRVALQLEGVDLRVPAVEGPLDSLSTLGFGTPADPLVKPLLRIGTTLVPVDPEQVGDPGQRPSGTVVAALPTLPTGWAYPAMSKTGTEIAAVGGDRGQLARWRGKTQVQLLTFGSNLTRPTYDNQDGLWVAGRDKDETKVWVVNTAADPTDSAKSGPRALSASWLGDRRIVSLRVSPDGQRVAIVSTDAQGQGPHLDVAGVVREANGVPTSLAAPLSLAPTLTLMRDVVWVDDATLVVLGRRNAGQVLRPWTVPLGGQITAGPEISGARTITTINGERGLVVTTDSRQVLLRAGSRWQRVGEGTDLLVPAR
ncbi:LpqB family beta-propeller domain-containing protein [Pedococcus sp. KACC 23699]|uniref:LpqB family beta-propeller domain-containing protein n=1 Tax=Pedococcus sp. KACC 23699 TaxID=3149228 RepID=A0AAU7JVR6_9MICO